MNRYYLSQTTDGAWKITKQDNTSGSWEDTETMKIYQTWQEALNEANIYSTLCYDPNSSWPEELGGQV